MVFFVSLLLFRFVVFDFPCGGFGVLAVWNSEGVQKAAPPTLRPTKPLKQEVGRPDTRTPSYGLNYYLFKNPQKLKKIKNNPCIALIIWKNMYISWGVLKQLVVKKCDFSV